MSVPLLRFVPLYAGGAEELPIGPAPSEDSGGPSEPSTLIWIVLKLMRMAALLRDTLKLEFKFAQHSYV